MANALRWILTKKWHAWPLTGRRTLCGTVTVEHLRESPAQRIERTPPVDADFCQNCKRKAGIVTPSSLAATEAAWMGHLRRHLTRVRVRVAEATLVELAGLLAEVGAPESSAGRDVFDQVRSLLLTPMRRTSRSAAGRTVTVVTLPYLKETIAKLPPRTGALTQIAAALRCYRTITRRDPTTDRFRPDRVVEVMLQLPTPEPYIRHLLDRGLPHLAAMFHPNTLARAKRETALRGLFAGTNDYWTDTSQQLNVITE